MSSNTFGKHFTLTTFGESHGKAIGGIIDGCPSGLELDLKRIQSKLEARRPGTSKKVSERKEEDKLQILSGVFEGKTTGMPIAFMIENKDAQSKDYEALKDLYRPSHADYTYQTKYGHRDHRGGGRQSARETANWVVAGAIAEQVLHDLNINIEAQISQVGPLKREEAKNFEQEMNNFILSVKEQGDSLGGVISCRVQNMPVGLGEPVFNKFHAKLGMAMLSINAAKGFDIGLGFDGVHLKGSELNDEFVKDSSGRIVTKTNHSGGVLGGISNGNDLEFRVAFKPPSSINKKQNIMDHDGDIKSMKIEGRHDPCVLPRAIPIVEAMTAVVLLDFYLANKLTRLH